MKDESYRDKVATVDKEGNRIWLYPKKPNGKYYNYRSLLSYFLLILLFTAPFIKIGGEPLLQINVLARKFVFLGQVFWPQDFYLFAFAMIAFVVFIILFTVVFGRLFCGWVCPQTIFMEMLFRKIEYFIEGDSTQQKALNKRKGTFEYTWKKGVKHSIFFLISFHIANTFLAYIIGGDEVFKITIDDPHNHIGGLTTISIFTFIFYFVFSKLREQVCTSICPYGRMQGVLLDRNSIVVAYDYIRGENRGKLNKNEVRTENGKGDCIDCKQCVHVCPTGIDIRDGVQLECVNCTACIDACDFIMEKVGQPKGLIRYASEVNIAESKPFEVTNRIKAYSVVLMLLLIGFFALLFSRTDVDTTLLRTPGMLYQKQEDGRLSNLYNFKILNKTHYKLPVHFVIESMDAEIKIIGKQPVVEPNHLAEGALFIIADKKQLDGLKTSIKIGVYSGERKLETISTNFVGTPNK